VRSTTRDSRYSDSFESIGDASTYAREPLITDAASATASSQSAGVSVPPPPRTGAAARTYGSSARSRRLSQR
jgi:hypothetical protein